MSYFANGISIFAASLALGGLAGVSDRALADEVAFETIEEGSTSYFDYPNCELAGSEFVFTDRASWEQFWEAHSRGRYPAPPLPEVKFARESVVAVLRECHSPSEGPRIAIYRVEQIDRETRIHVLKFNGLGTDAAIGDAFHIVKIPRVKGSVSFLHEVIGWSEAYCSTDVECHPAMICNLRDSTCEATYLEGTCELPSSCPNSDSSNFPVCGCDGVTYADDCLRINAGVTLRHLLECRD